MPFTVLVFAGALTAVAYSLDTSRTVDSLSQVKRATDAAAMAVGYKEVANTNSDDVDDLKTLASRYIQVNLGLDSELKKQVDLSSVNVERDDMDDGSVTYKVSVKVDVEAPELGVESELKTVYSTVEVGTRPTEIALMIPNTEYQNENDLAALRRLSRQFALNFLYDGDENGQEAEKRWLSLIPYSENVNVYDEQDPDRITRWAAEGALRPPELRSLFQTGQVNNLADPRFPDRTANILGMYRGMEVGEDYFWDQNPTAQFQVYYRHDEAENANPGEKVVTWVGPNPELWPSNMITDVRTIVTDYGSPLAPVLPLTDDIDKIDARLNKMTRRWLKYNYAIAMGWAATSLSPQMRGNAGWGDPRLPLDFSPNEQNYKAIVMLIDVDDEPDTDGYNKNKHKKGTTGTEISRTVAMRRMASLCKSFRRRNLHFFLVGIRSADSMNKPRVYFEQYLLPGMNVCTEGKNNIHFVNAEGFAQVESQIGSFLEGVAEDVRKSYYVRLIK